MKIREIDSWLANNESGKSEAKIGDVREIRKLMCELLVSPEGLKVYATMIKAGKRLVESRSKKVTKKVVKKVTKKSKK